MLKSFAIAMIALTATALTATAAQARGGRCYRGAAPSYAVAAPGTATAAAPTTGDRTYSYEPGMYVAPARRSYGAPYGTPNVFRDAGGKIRGY